MIYLILEASLNWEKDEEGLWEVLSSSLNGMSQVTSNNSIGVNWKLLQYMQQKFLL